MLYAVNKRKGKGDGDVMEFYMYINSKVLMVLLCSLTACIIMLGIMLPTIKKKKGRKKDGRKNKGKGKRTLR